MFFKLAFLNLTRHPKRTILILFAVLMSVFVMEFVGGMLEGMRHNFFTNLLSDSGHIQLHAQGWQDRLNPYSLDYLLENPQEIINSLESKQEVIEAEKIFHFGALLIKDEKNLHIECIGVQPETAYFSQIRNGIKKGAFLPEGKGIVLSSRIAELLDVEYNDRIVILVEDSTGSPYYMEYPITGVFSTGSKETDESAIYINHSEAAELLYAGDATNEIRISLHDRNNAELFVDSIKPLLERNNAEASTWHDIHGSLIVFIKLFDIIMLIINILIIIVAATVITNAILMNVFERMEEFGTMRAIGLKKRQLFFLIMGQGGVLGLGGALLGLIVGIPLVLYFQKNGFAMGEVTEFLQSGSIYYFHFSVRNSVINFGSGILITLAGSLYAAIVAIRLRIIETLNFA